MVALTSQIRGSQRLALDPASPLRQEIGLGQAKEIIFVEIRWPAGETQTWRGLGLDHFYHVREGDANATALKLATFKWPGPDQALPPHEHK